MSTALHSHPIERRRTIWCPGVSPRHSSPNAAQSVGYREISPTHEPETELSSETRALRLNIETTVAYGFDLEPELLSFPSRGRAPVAQARQVSMYLAHVCLSCSLSQVGQMFNRDRTTVAHACEMVEMRRDMAEFDLVLTRLELIIRIMCGRPGISHGITAPAPCNLLQYDEPAGVSK
jgi:Bacterial dnaA protein helix-turn-helix